MPFSPDDIAAIQTPAVVIDLDIANENILRFQQYASSHSLRVRPHIKTHKLPALAELQIAAGAIGITCQKISEAEAMAAGSSAIKDILITYNIVGSEKLQHLKALARRVKLTVVADSATVVDGLAAAFRTEAEPLTVMVNAIPARTAAAYPPPRLQRLSLSGSTVRPGSCSAD